MTFALAITPGEPAGIGPDLLVALAQQGSDDQLVAIADPALLQARAKQLGLPLRLHPYDPAQAPCATPHGELWVDPIHLMTACEPGKLNPTNARYVLATLDRAIERCQNGELAALVTGPVHKGVINQAGIAFSGHTEYLAEKTHTDKVVMMLATTGLRVALATTHLPLAKVPEAITREDLTTTLRVLHRAMQTDFAIAKPHIAVCGLNPHAGEGGHLGREEIEVIEPVLASLRAEGMNLVGPLPADTLFTPHNLRGVDVVLAMYHDQGLPVLKYKGFGRAVNITLGLPIIRTSVDHGTALDLVGTGRADTGSLSTALANARELARARRSGSTAR